MSSRHPNDRKFSQVKERSSWGILALSSGSSYISSILGGIELGAAQAIKGRTRWPVMGRNDKVPREKPSGKKTTLFLEF